MSGFLALLDDMAAIAKIAAASVDDVAAAAAKASTKTAGLLIDDAAVTPKYVTGFKAERELPIIWRIAKGSFFNKLVILLPALLLLQTFVPQAITPLLMLGGAYLCFEGAEKIAHVVWPHPPGEAGDVVEGGAVKDATTLEEEKIAGAIKTDFILSAEIMTIALSVIHEPSMWLQVTTLAVVAILMTTLVYGVVGVIVKMDDVGLHLATNARLGATRAFGRGLVQFMPRLLTTLTIVGTAAMLWVGGNIVIHGLEGTQIWSWPYAAIHALAERLASGLSFGAGFVRWLVTAACDGVFGLALGLFLIPVVTKVIAPLWRAVRPKAA